MLCFLLVFSDYNQTTRVLRVWWARTDGQSVSNSIWMSQSDCIRGALYILTAVLEWQRSSLFLHNSLMCLQHSRWWQFISLSRHMHSQDNSWEEENVSIYENVQITGWRWSHVSFFCSCHRLAALFVGHTKSKHLYVSQPNEAGRRL